MAINRSNGGITGVKNKPSGGGNVVTTIRASGNFNVPCAMIIGKRKESTDKKTSLNAALRENNVSI